MRFQQKKKNCTKDKNEPHEHIMFIHVFSRRSEQRKIILSVITIILKVIKNPKCRGLESLKAMWLCSLKGTN